MSSSPETRKQAAKKPPKNRFIQQELPAWKPILTPGWVLFILFGIAAVFIPIGAVCLQASRSVVEIYHRYDTCLEGTDDGARERVLQQANGEGLYCAPVQLTVPADMYGPVYLYYELGNFYQNHRRYVKSRSHAQLRGEDVPAEELGVCAPQQYLGGDETKPINPCGLTAWSYFNDTFELNRCAGAGCEALPNAVAVSTEGIAWESDVGSKFGAQRAENFNPPGPLRGGATVLGPIDQDERFVVWMRTAALPRFRKLWGYVPAPASGPTLRAGEAVRLRVLNRYNTYGFGGSKAFVLSTASWLGGRNDFLGAAFLGAGLASLAAALAFLLLRWRWPRRLGDLSNLSWSRASAAADAPAPST